VRLKVGVKMEGWGERGGGGLLGQSVEVEVAKETAVLVVADAVGVGDAFFSKPAIPGGRGVFVEKERVGEVEVVAKIDAMKGEA